MCMEYLIHVPSTFSVNRQFSESLIWACNPVNSASPEHIIMKRSEAYAARGSWKNVLMDANEVYSIVDLRGTQKSETLITLIQVVRRDAASLPQA